MKREIVRKLMEAQPHIRPKHRTPVTRRELFGAGYLAVGGMVLMPQFDRLFGNKAFADGVAECSGGGQEGLNLSATICVDLGGGATLPFNFPPLNSAGTFLNAGSYHTIGMPASLDPNTVLLDSTFGIPMNPQSRILQGMKATLGIDNTNSAADQAGKAMAERVNGYITCVSNNDDTQNNEHNLLMGLAKLGYQRLIHAIGDSDNANGSGGRSAPVADWFDATKIPVTIRRKEDAINIVLPPILKDYLPNTSYAQVTDMITRWSLADQAYFMSRSESEQTEIVKRLADKKCSYIDSSSLVSKYTPAEVDIDRDPNEEFRNIWAAEKGTGSIVKLLADNIAVGGVVTLGGYDYHGSGSQNQNDRDMRAGQMLGRIIRSFCIKKKNVMISLYTDGGTSSATDTPLDAAQGRVPGTGDSGQRGLRVTFFVNGAGTTRPGMTTSIKQFGAYNNTGAVDTSADTLISTSPAKCCAVDLLNLLKFDGNLALANQLDLPDPNKYGIMLETKPS